MIDITGGTHTALMFGPFIVTALNAAACIEAGDKGDLVARRVLWGINAWLTNAYTNQDMACVCRECPTRQLMFSKQHQPAAFLVMLPMREQDHLGMVVAACEHCLQHHADNLQTEMECAIRQRYPDLTMQSETLH